MIIRPSNRLNQVQSYYFATKLAQVRQMNEKGMNVINLGIGSPDLPPPQSVIDRLIDQSGADGNNMYQSYSGIPELREAFAKWYLTQFNVSLNPNKEILPLIGSKEGIMHISMSFLQSGDQVLVPNPGYISYRVTAQLAGATVINYELNDEKNWLPDLNELSKLDLSAVKIMWVNYPHMPTGAKATKAFYEELLAFARQHEILICHDNPYSFILNDQPLSILELDASKEYCIELNSLSKSYNMAGWRVGVLCGGREYIRTVMKFKSNMDSGMYRGIQVAAIEALKQDKSWFDEMNSVYEKRRKKAWKIMDLLGCNYRKDTAGMFVWAAVPSKMLDVETWLEQILQESRVFITPGFIFGSQGERYIRLSLCRSSEQLDQAYQRIEKVLMATNLRG